MHASGHSARAKPRRRVCSAEVGGRYWRSFDPSGDRTGGARLLITKCRGCVDFGGTLCSARTRGSASKGMARDSSGAAVVVGTGSSGGAGTTEVEATSLRAGCWGSGLDDRPLPTDRPNPTMRTPVKTSMNAVRAITHVFESGRFQPSSASSLYEANSAGGHVDTGSALRSSTEPSAGTSRGSAPIPVCVLIRWFGTCVRESITTTPSGSMGGPAGCLANDVRTACFTASPMPTRQ